MTLSGHEDSSNSHAASCIASGFRMGKEGRLRTASLTLTIKRMESFETLRLHHFPLTAKVLHSFVAPSLAFHHNQRPRESPLRQRSAQGALYASASRSFSGSLALSLTCAFFPKRQMHQSLKRTSAKCLLF